MREKERNGQRKHKNRSIENRGTCLTDKFLERERGGKKERERENKQKYMFSTEESANVHKRERKKVSEKDRKRGIKREKGKCKSTS